MCRAAVESGRSSRALEQSGYLKIEHSTAAGRAHSCRTVRAGVDVEKQACLISRIIHTRAFRVPTILMRMSGILRAHIQAKYYREGFSTLEYPFNTYNGMITILIDGPQVTVP